MKRSLPWLAAMLLNVVVLPTSFADATMAPLPSAATAAMQVHYRTAKVDGVVQNGNDYDEGIGKFWDPIKAYWETGAPKEREGIRWLISVK